MNIQFLNTTKEGLQLQPVVPAETPNVKSAARTMGAKAALGDGTIEFDSLANESNGVDAINTAALSGLAIATVYLLYLFVAQHINPIIYILSQI